MHPTVISRLGELYAEQVSPLGARVLVQGNPVYLGQPPVVAEVRALLLAGLRAAVLWRQLGGSRLDFLLRRGAMVDAAQRLLSPLD
jgi:high frequency lysogenization protein